MISKSFVFTFVMFNLIFLNLFLLFSRLNRTLLKSIINFYTNHFLLMRLLKLMQTVVNRYVAHLLLLHTAYARGVEE